jgi:membrane protease YdiL (CAAX protease family)
MQENELIEAQDLPATAPQLPEPRVRMVLLAQLGLFVFCAGIGVFLYKFICALAGWEVLTTLVEGSPIAERWQVRLYMGLGHFFMFLVSGALTVWIFYRGITQTQTSWPDYLQTRQWPRLTTLLLGILLMAASMPLVLYSLNINQQIPLPEFFKTAELQAAEALKGLLQMEHAGELLANLVIIALLPALGEELVFRGVVQQQLMRRIANPWVAILVSAMVFSAAHVQFEGFLPRMLLGFLLGWLYWRTRSFWVPVVGHFFNNGIQVLGQYLYGKELSSVDLEKDIQVPWEFAAVSAFMVWAVMRLIGQTVKK